jgi:hypothetical protein
VGGREKERTISCSPTGNESRLLNDILEKKKEISS